MLSPLPDMTSLFDQLGLDSSQDAIEAFFRHKHLNQNEDVSEADFLSFEQRLALTRMRDDAELAELAELVDTMESLLHKND